MKELPTIQTRKSFNFRSLGVLGLIALLLTVSYLGSIGNKPVSATIPMEQVSLTATQTAQEREGVHPSAMPSEAPAVITAVTPFDKYREDLEAARKAAGTQLDEVILNTAANAETVQEALRQKTALAKAMEVEASMEALIKARGYSDVLCTYREGSVNVVIKGASLTQQQASQILDIAMAESGAPASNIRIIPAE